MFLSSWVSNCMPFEATQICYLFSNATALDLSDGFFDARSPSITDLDIPLLSIRLPSIE
jgi:hypothetical protein